MPSAIGFSPENTLWVSSLFWIFNFLNIGAQTEVAQSDGKGHPEKASDIASLSLTMAIGFGLMLILLILPNANWLAELMGASGDVHAEAVSYMQIRTYGAPAVLLMMVTFGVLRGLQDMRTPLWIALGMNALNEMEQGNPYTTDIFATNNYVNVAGSQL